MFRLNKKTAIVSGGSKGIGKAIALKYAQAGADVVICSRRKENLEAAVIEAESNGFSLIPIECNTSNFDSIQSVVDLTMDKFGKVDILVNNAATNPYYGPILNSEDSHWDKIFDVNVKGYFNFAKACSISMIKNNYGKIINVASIAAKTPLEGLGVYNISKAALIMLTKNQSIEWGKYNIRVNAICPGYVRTKLSSGLLEFEGAEERLVNNVSLRRASNPDEMAGLAVFLASEASSYVTGTSIVNDGGLLNSPIF